MECNRDEAIRAKEIAEKMFAAKDINGARKFAFKANSLFPELEGIQKMVSTLDVYISAERKIHGETDWYAVLGVDPKADDETVRKHYRKLALMLHPDKNKSIGAEGAFKLISESWSMLSDKARRSAYDRKRRSRITPLKVPPPSGPNGFPDMDVHTTNNSKVSSHHVPVSPNINVHTTNNSKGSSHHVPVSPHKKNTTFWTVCHRCKMQYEYLRIYLNHNLLCPSCRHPFLATESTAPANDSKLPFQNIHSHNHTGGKTSTSTVGGHSNMGNYSTNSRNETKFQWVPFSGPAVGVSTSSEAAASMVHSAYEQVKRERKEAQAAKRKKTNSRLPNAKRRKGHDEGHKGAEATAASKTSSSGVRKCISELSHFDCQNILMETVRKSIHNKLKDLSHLKQMNEVKEKSHVFEKKDITGNLTLTPSLGKEPREVITILEVSDPDFYIFDKDRTEKCFRENQVWAVYCYDDCMPRHYAIINSVISLNPFKVKLNWLKSKISICHLAASGLRKTCGDFGIGKFEVYSSLNSFSHKVSWTKGDEGTIRIFPRKGDIWALYRNWSPEWNELTSNEVIQTFDVVEVLESYDENIGVIVIPLVKVAGFKTVFHHHLDPDKESLIPKEEMARFSHQVPAHLLRGQEASPYFLKGCWELDPAATPLPLQVIVGKCEKLNVEIEDEVRVLKLDELQGETPFQNSKRREIIDLIEE